MSLGDKGWFTLKQVLTNSAYLEYEDNFALDLGNTSMLLLLYDQGYQYDQGYSVQGD